MKESVYIMAYCKNCGTQIDDQAVFCSKCGTNQTAAPAVKDKGGFWWGTLGCCIPVVGLVLFLVWKDTKPKTSKAAGIGALVSLILGIIYLVLVCFVGVAVGLY